MADAWIRILDDSPPVSGTPERSLGRAEPAAGSLADDPAALILTCANCGAAMDERKCKLICSCGYFLSCSDYY
jgi:hypothetical protein